MTDKKRASRKITQNALIVDWDYFFFINPLWDWGHNENHPPALQDALWHGRAADFLMRDKALPTVEAGWQDFWQGNRLLFGSTLYVADSNVYAIAAIDRTFGHDLSNVGIWLFDQHHDSGYHGQESWDHASKYGLTCENWMLPLWLRQPGRRRNIHVVYPEHRDDAFDSEPQPAIPIDRRFVFDYQQEEFPAFYDMVFVCRSGAWVPPWCDDQFNQFIEACPAQRAGTVIEFPDLRARPFVSPNVEQLGRQIERT